MDLYVSFTSIPTRINSIEKCIDSLINQDYPIEKIIITLPLTTLRQYDVDYQIPDFLKSKFKDKIIITRPEKDYGPIMKYIGSKNVIPKNSLVFVCDDDQEYHPQLISKLVKRYKQEEKIYGENLMVASVCYQLLLTKVLNGYGGVLFNSNLIDKLYKKIVNSSQGAKNACQLVDDNWISIVASQNGIKVISLQLDYPEIHISGHNQPDDGLGKMTGRYKRIYNCTYTIDNKNVFFTLIVIIILIITILFITNRFWKK